MNEGAPKVAVFAREATGLIRNFSWVETFLMGAGMLGVSSFTWAAQFAYIIPSAPGADVPLSTFIGFLIWVPMGVVYYYFAVMMPRTGGDYVWVSRLGQPILGFVAGWGYWIACLYLSGMVAYMIATVTAPVFLVTLGYGLGNPGLVGMATSLVSSSTNIVVVALAFLVFAYLVAGINPKIFSVALKVMFILNVLSILGMWAVFATSTHADFVNAINGYGGTNLTYNGVMNEATAGGWSYAPISWGATLASIPMSVLLYTGFTWSVAAGGEIRNPKKSMLIGVLGVLVVGMIVTIVGMWGSLALFGYNFLQASTFLSSIGTWPIPAPPFTQLLAAPLIKNQALLVIVEIGWMTALPMNTCGVALISIRYPFAFAFDRVFPARVSNVSDRFHFPLNATILCFIGSVSFALISVYEGYVTASFNMTAIWCVLWILVSVVAIILPATRFKDLSKTLPGGNWAVPPLSIIGGVSLIAMIMTFYYSVTNPLIGPSTPAAQHLLEAIFVIGLLVYIGSYYYNKRLGVDLKMVYAQIPPE